MINLLIVSRMFWWIVGRMFWEGLLCIVIKFLWLVWNVFERLIVDCLGRLSTMFRHVYVIILVFTMSIKLYLF